jgi:hypothetical protein
MNDPVLLAGWEDRQSAIKPQLALEMLTRAWSAGSSARWVNGRDAYGADCRLRMQLEAHPQASVLVVPSQESI